MLLLTKVYMTGNVQLNKVLMLRQAQ